MDLPLGKGTLQMCFGHHRVGQSSFGFTWIHSKHLRPKMRQASSIRSVYPRPPVHVSGHAAEEWGAWAGHTAGILCALALFFASFPGSQTPYRSVQCKPGGDLQSGLHQWTTSCCIWVPKFSPASERFNLLDSSRRRSTKHSHKLPLSHIFPLPPFRTCVRLVSRRFWPYKLQTVFS